MEYIHGDSLRNRLRDGAWPSLELILKIGADVASALAAVHTAGTPTLTVLLTLMVVVESAAVFPAC